jgi:hypothetical protein
MSGGNEMDSSAWKRAAMWISVATLIYSFGCILSPEEESAPPINDPIKFEDLTEKEHVINNLVNSYKALDDSEYRRLLLRLEDEKPNGGGSYSSQYYWFNQPEDESELNVDLEEDANRTKNIFYAAKGTPVDPEKHQIIDRLTLTITDGVWTPVDSLFGGECDDCWKTRREYDINLNMGEDQIYGLDDVEFYIVPVQEGDKRTYRIAVAHDIFAN